MRWTREHIAGTLGVTVNAVEQWRKRSIGFPAPLDVICQCKKPTPTWDADSVMEWARTTGRA